MEELNYHHLLYFWHVAREGSVTKAADKLGVSQPTVSGQVAALEKQIGKPLFTRIGRGLVLGDTGRLVFEYADDIFRLGNELQQAIAAGQTKPGRLAIGVVDAVPKLLIQRLLNPIFYLPKTTRLIVSENKPDRLAADLAQNSLDAIITDAQIPQTIRVRAFHHSLGQSEIGIFASPKIASKLKQNFPASLTDTAFILPSVDSSLRRILDDWFASNNLHPIIRAEFADSALLKVFGQNGIGAFAQPIAVADEIIKQYEVQLVGKLAGIKQEFFAVTAARRVTHPLIGELLSSARERLFSNNNS